MDCIFCKIAKKELPSSIVFESDSLIAIKDINPQAPVHILLIPKKHFATMIECTDNVLLGNMLSTANEIAEKLGVTKNGFRIIINTNKEGGQTVFHLHIHLLGGRQLSGVMG